MRQTIFLYVILQNNAQLPIPNINKTYIVPGIHERPKCRCEQEWLLLIIEPPYGNHNGGRWRLTQLLSHKPASLLCLLLTRHTEYCRITAVP